MTAERQSTMTQWLPDGFIARPAQLDDVEAVVALVNACSLELIGKPECEASEYRNDWQSPSLNMVSDLRVVLAPDGKFVGYAGVWDPQPHVRLYSWGYVHPEYRGRGIGTYLVHWLEGRARQAVAQAPDGARVTLQQDRLTCDELGQALLRQQGFTKTRYFFRMLIEMETPPPVPNLPAGIRIRTFDHAADLRALIHADREAFKDHWGYVEHPFEEDYQEWVHWIANDPDHDPTLWFLAVDGEDLAGISLCKPKMAEDPEMGYISSLAVRRRWRRQGIALALLHHTFGEFFRRGTRKVSLDVDADSLTGALRLYEKAGMHVMRQSTNYEKELRPGEELSTQSLAE